MLSSRGHLNKGDFWHAKASCGRNPLKKSQKQLVHLLRLLFRNRVPGPGYDMNTLKMCTNGTHCFEGTGRLIDRPLALTANVKGRNINSAPRKARIRIHS